MYFAVPLTFLQFCSKTDSSVSILGTSNTLKGDTSNGTIDIEADEKLEKDQKRSTDHEDSCKVDVEDENNHSATCAGIVRWPVLTDEG